MGAAGTPRLVLGAASSGSGKTTFAVALAAAFRQRGLAVAPFKCGPDYLDPTWHARAAGRPSQNLDGWMMGREASLSTFARAAAGADLSIVEGVMGLFDGASPTSDEGSTAEQAKWLGAPVVAVLDASGMARTVAAVAQGLSSFDPDLRLAGILCNRVGSRSHLDLLRAAAAPLPVFGALPEVEALRFPERHLGLVTASEQLLDDASLARWAALAEEWIDLDALLAAGRAAAPLPAPPPPVARRAAERCRIGVARDEPFHFYYEDNLARLEALGAHLVPFSPLSDAAPPDVDGLYLGGGYPELHAARLSENRAMRGAIRAFAASGRPIYAECGGLMYLCEAIATLDGREHPMVGLVGGVARVRDRLQALGYAEVETTAPTLLGPAGLRLRGHQFRYSDLDGPAAGGAYRVRRRRGGDPFAEGFGTGNVLASWIHVHWASCPDAAEGFVRACARARSEPEGRR
jgi:cobyrinic acid a,c-diamide synthase